MTALAVETVAFDPEATASMGIAFEKACRSLGNGKQAPPPSHSASTCRRRCSRSLTR